MVMRRKREKLEKKILSLRCAFELLVILEVKCSILLMYACRIGVSLWCSDVFVFGYSLCVLPQHVIKGDLSLHVIKVVREWLQRYV